MYNLKKLRNFYHYIAMTISKLRNFFESLQLSQRRLYERNPYYIHVFITHVFRIVVVLMIEDIRAFETKNTVFLFRNQ